MRRATRDAARAGYRGDISIHALHEESDSALISPFSIASLFQSTLSMRRATLDTMDLYTNNQISIHALHEESDNSHTHNKHDQKTISIHALHEESDRGAEYG